MNTIIKYIRILCIGGMLTNLNANISGTVFKDLPVNGSELNPYGVKDVNEKGISGVTVTVYPKGLTTTTATDGTWHLESEGKVRVEFSNWPSYLQESMDAGRKNASVRFVENNEIVNFGLYDINEYHNTVKPDYITNIFINGDGKNDFFALTSNKYEDSELNKNYTHHTKEQGKGPIPTTILKQKDIGTVWGIGYQPSINRVYISTVLKRHFGFAYGNLSRIYYADITTHKVNYFDLQGVIPANGGDAIDLGSIVRVPDDLKGPLAPSKDNDAYAKVGKVAYGDLEFDSKTHTVWTVNLYQRAIISIDTLGIDPITNSIASSSVKQYPLDTLNAPTCTGGILRPWGFSINNGHGYIGAICDALFSQNRDDIVAYVLSFDINNPLEEIEVEVKYNMNPTSNFEKYNIHAWTDQYQNTVDTTWDYYSQLILSGIEFDADGNMYLAFFDRYGFQIGEQNKDYNNSAITESSKGLGRIRKVCLIDGIYKVEGTNEACPHQTHIVKSNGTISTDDFFNDYGGDNTNNVDGGALALVKGNREILRVVNDPHPNGITGEKYWVTNGTQIHSLEDGSIKSWYAHLYSLGREYTGKSAGMGDIEFLQASAPVELGNRVWIDKNANGIQDFNEPGLSNVIIKLLDNLGVELASAKTDIDGYYIFSNSDSTISTPSHKYGVKDLHEGNSYLIRIEHTQGKDQQTALEGYTLSPSNVGENNLIDNDGVSNGVHSNILVRTMDISNIGTNNHSFDFGFTEEADEPTNAAIGNLFWIDENGNGVVDNTERGYNGVKVTLMDENGTVIATQTTRNGSDRKPGYYLFDNLIPGEIYQVHFDYSNVADLKGYIYSPTVGGDDKNNANEEGFTVSVTPQAGERILTLDAGINCGCSDIKGDSGDTLSLFGMLGMLFMSLFAGLFFVRKEELQA